MEKTIQNPVAHAQMKAENGTTWQLEYYMQPYQSTDGTNMFGISVHKLDLDGQLLESNDTYALSENPDKVMAIIEFLASGNVPPCVLGEMVDEWFALDTWQNEPVTA